MLTKLMFRLLPIQILIAAVGSVNGIISSYFATNYVGNDAMSAVGLYGPIYLLVSCFSTILFCGSVILCGKYLGQNQHTKLRSCFTLTMILSVIISVLFIAAFVVMGMFDLTGFLSKDEVVRPLFNKYLLGQAIGVLPLIIGNQLPAFLSLENKSNRTIVATVVYIIVNLILNYFFVKVLGLQAFGLSLASSLGMWVYLGVQAQYFFTERCNFKLCFFNIDWKECLSIIKIGYPGALGGGYQTIRGFIVNKLLTIYIGSVGLSAFATANNLLSVFWAIPAGMLAVSRMIMSVSIGEEDRQTLIDNIKVMLTRYLPVMAGVSALLTLFAVPLTQIFYHDTSDPVFMMTVWAIRIIPWSMPTAVIANHFVCYWQASSRQIIVHIISILDGFVCVCAITAILISSIGINALYIANVANGVIIVLVIVIHAFVINKSSFLHIKDLLCIPDDFGALDGDRIDISIKDLKDVIIISRRVQSFCESKGIEHMRAMLAGLSMEEMAGNIINHGFTKDKKSHSVDVRVVYKAGDVILRLKDDCVPFDVVERKKISDDTDKTKNVGIKMIFKIAKKVEYQSLLGLNVFTIRV